MAKSPWMLMSRPVLQEGSKGALPEGACDSQPLARESMDQCPFLTV